MKIKKCPRCGKKLDIKEFHSNDCIKSNYLTDWCKKCVLKFWMDKRAGVYLIKEEHGLTKIGYTVDIIRRFKLLQQGMPYKIELLYYRKINTAQKMEKTLHKLFKNKRKKGEWFYLTIEDIDKIKIILNRD